VPHFEGAKIIHSTRERWLKYILIFIIKFDVTILQLKWEDERSSWWGRIGQCKM
jgi:hypothetical protein